MRAAPQTAADKALEERDRIYRRYRKTKKAEFDRLCADPQWGERLRKFAATVNHFDIEDADEMIAYVRRHAPWLRHEAPDDIRFAALQAIDHRIVRIRQRAGLAPFDDPLPDEEPDVWQLCQRGHKQMKISIKELLGTYGSGLQKTWEHDRLNTVGASEVGQCLRKIFFSKTETPADPDYEDRFGAKLRGNIIEGHYWVPGLRASLPEGVELRYAGDEQRTFVDGYLSATPDGVLAPVERDCLAHMGIADIGADCLAVEAKSIDPRVDIRIEKPEHSFQTQAQMGLLRFATGYWPNYALISYVDASFLDDVREFAVEFDQRIYDTAKERARRVFTTDDALDLPPEGKLAGGQECKYCPWQSHCAAVTVAGIPPTDEVRLGDNAAAELKRLRDAERDLAARKDATETEHATAREAVKEFLRVNGIRRYTGEGWGVSWSSVKGRETVDTKAAEAAGLDLSRFKKAGDPADRLTVK